MSRQGNVFVRHLKKNMEGSLPLTGHTSEEKENQICLLYCETFYDYEECKKVCLAASPQNKSLYRQALLQAEKDGLNDEHAHVFAAGAIWSWVKSR